MNSERIRHPQKTKNAIARHQALLAEAVERQLFCIGNDRDNGKVIERETKKIKVLSSRLRTQELRLAITAAECKRDAGSQKWTPVDSVDLLDLKNEWARLTGRDWRGA